MIVKASKWASSSLDPLPCETINHCMKRCPDRLLPVGIKQLCSPYALLCVSICNNGT